MSIVSRLTVTPLLYGMAGLLLLCVLMGVQLKLERGRTETAVLAQQTAEAQRDAAVAERDAWKLRAEDNARAANIARDNVATLRGELRRVQGDLRTLDAQSRQSIAAAEAGKRDAERTLSKFTAQFQAESRKPDCTRALEAVGRVCPALEGY